MPYAFIIKRNIEKQYAYMSGLNGFSTLVAFTKKFVERANENNGGTCSSCKLPGNYSACITLQIFAFFLHKFLF